MSLRDDFLAEVETFLGEFSMDASAFGREALKDPNFVFELRGDRAPNVRTIERVREFMTQRRAGVAA